jgi:putative transposase
VTNTPHYHPAQDATDATLTFVERFIQTIQVETLDYFIAFGEKHFNYLCQSFLDFYHRCRPHQAKDNELLVPISSQTRRQKQMHANAPPLSDVRCQRFLGGRLRHYYRKAA